MQDLWRLLLRRDIPAGWLSTSKIAVFGLGDSGFTLYNVMARKLFQRLLDLGAKMLDNSQGDFSARGLGDDQDKFGYGSVY